MLEEIGKDFAVELSTILAQDFDRADYLGAIGTCYGGVLSGDKVAVINNGSFADSVVAGCNPAWGTPAGSTDATWELGNFMIAKQYCYDTMVPEIKRFEKLYELSTVEAAKKWISAQMESAFAQSVIARGFFGSTKAADYTTAGFVGSQGLFTDALNAITAGTADATQETAIATNTKAWLKTDMNAVNTLESLISDADADIKASPNAVIVINSDFWDAVGYNLKVNKGINIESQWTALFGGLKETTYEGYKVIVVPAIDAINKKMVTGDLFFGHPNIALFTTQDNMLFASASDERAGIGTVKVFDDDNTQTTRALVKYSLGAMIPNKKKFQLAY